MDTKNQEQGSVTVTGGLLPRTLMSIAKGVTIFCLFMHLRCCFTFCTHYFFCRPKNKWMNEINDSEGSAVLSASKCMAKENNDVWKRRRLESKQSPQCSIAHKKKSRVGGKRTSKSPRAACDSAEVWPWPPTGCWLWDRRPRRSDSSRMSQLFPYSLIQNLSQQRGWIEAIYWMCSWFQKMT